MLYSCPVSTAMFIVFCVLLHQSPLFLMAPNHSLGCYDEIAVNCGSKTPPKALEGRKWIGDTPSMLNCSPKLTGESSSSTSMQMEDQKNDDPVPYRTVRISRSKFSYLFQVNPGQKLIRLHFNSVPYKSFNNVVDLFTVVAGPFTLMENFSASLAANADDSHKMYFVREYLISVDENANLELHFSPVSRDTYAFINVIEVIPLPSSMDYTGGGDLGVEVVVGHKFRTVIDKSFGLEMVHRSNTTSGCLASLTDDSSSKTSSKRWGSSKKPNTMYNLLWKVSVDVGFGYLLRLHFCETLVNKAGRNCSPFAVHVDSSLVETEGVSVPWYRDYVVMKKGSKKDGRRDVVIVVQFDCVDLNNGPIKAFEVLKMSNSDNSLASPNPCPPVSRASPFRHFLQKFTAQLLDAIKYKKSVLPNIIFVTVILGVFFYIVVRLREAKLVASDDDKIRTSDFVSSKEEGQCRRFSLSEMRSATNDFSNVLLIGRGGFGEVYKGCLESGQYNVAIKRLRSNSKQGANEFWMEVETLSKLRHVHLVSLIGYCNEGPEMILVYEFMFHGTLADLLYKQCGKSECYVPLSWDQRLQICVGAARGLDYLHMGTKTGVIHRDVKTSNILLDEHYVAKVSDFGLAKVGNREQSFIDSTNVRGTFGYLDPHYFVTHKLTVKSDVYAFGVVLLEVLCGRAAVDPNVSENQRSLTMWAKEYIRKGQIYEIVDANLRGYIPHDRLEVFVEIIDKCLQAEPKYRPTMAHIVAQLEAKQVIQDAGPSQYMPSVVEDEQSGSGLIRRKEKKKTKSVQNHVLPVRDDKKPPKPSPWIYFWFWWPKAPKNIVKKPLFFQDAPCCIFSTSDILEATKNFDDSLIIRKDDFYEAYVATDSSSRKVVVERVKRTPQDKLKEMCEQIEMLSQLQHLNLASVMGYCCNDKELIIVYDYVSNFTLSDYLYKKGVGTLSWQQRIEICIGAASGVSYLHTDRNRTVLHNDIRHSNIYLDSKMAAKFVNVGFSHFGPVPPDLPSLPNEKSDVYSFGLILLEVIFGKRIMKEGSNPYNLPNLVKQKIKGGGTLHQMIEPDIRKNMAVESLSRFLKIALKCVLDEPASRPSMHEVVWGVQDAQEAQDKAEATSEIHKELLFVQESGLYLEDLRADGAELMSLLDNITLKL